MKMKHLMILLLMFIVSAHCDYSLAKESRCSSVTEISQNVKWTATYYGNNYKGRRHTANGDVFDMNAMTCAAPKSFKFGTKLRVTNIKNNKSVVVTVTDRGGFGNHTIDLTYGAFGKIANHREGRIRIAVEVLS